MILNKTIAKKDIEKVFKYISSFRFEEEYRGCLFIYDDNFNMRFEERIGKYRITWDLESYLEYRSTSKKY